MKPLVVPEKPLSVQDYFKDKIFRKGEKQQVRIEFKHYEDQEYMELRVYEKSQNGEWNSTIDAMALPIGSLENTLNELHNVQKLVQQAQIQNDKENIGSLIIRAKELHDKGKIGLKVITEMAEASLKALYGGESIG